MTKVPKYWSKAKLYLSKKDKIMKNLILKYKSPSEKILTTRKDIFYSLCKSIIGQQISVAAADSVFKRFRLLCKNKSNGDNPELSLPIIDGYLNAPSESIIGISSFINNNLILY